MKNVLVILDGTISKYLLKRMVELNNNLNHYDVIYTDPSILPKTLPSNFILYQFDPTSYSKLSFVLNKVNYQDALLVLNSKADTIAVVDNIRKKHKTLSFTIYDQWGLQFNDENIKYYRGYDILSNGLVEQLPNIPVFAQNIGQRRGEIMEVKIPFGSTYAYRYIGSIAQKDWRIVALYRNEKLTEVKPSLVLKPNDVIIIIGKPKVLVQVYSAISKSHTQFPMPFGNNIYIYVDMFIQNIYEILNAIEDSKILHKRMRNEKLVIKITRPTNMLDIQKIKDKLVGVEDCIMEFDYHNEGIHKILKEDKIKFDIGLIVLTREILSFKEAVADIVSLKLPIFKVGSEHVSSLKNSLLLLHENNIYEQLAPIMFDISHQLKIKPKILNLDPVGDQNREDLLAHLNNLGKIFNENIILKQEDANPIKTLYQEKNILQILPLKADMFEKRKYKFFTTDSDLLSYDINIYNQILIPVAEEIN
jgi:hypothetical protein